jgi:hypothetical protein
MMTIAIGAALDAIPLRLSNLLTDAPLNVVDDTAQIASASTSVGQRRRGKRFQKRPAYAASRMSRLRNCAVRRATSVKPIKQPTCDGTRYATV